MNRHVAPAGQPATYRDVLDAPLNMVAEFVDGALHLHPRPALRNARASFTRGVRIGGPFDEGRRGPGGWWAIDGPEQHIRPDVLVPDLCGWRRDRMPEIADAPWTELAPDWICEVLGPGTMRIDLTDKRRIYAVAAVAHLWPIDPTARRLEAFAFRDGAWTLTAALKDEEEVRVPPLDAVAFPLSALWPD